MARDTGAKLITLAIGEREGAMPKIGVGVPADEARFITDNLDLAKRLGVEALICQIDLRKEHGRSEMAAYRKLAEATDAAVTLEVITLGSLDPLGEMTGVAKEAQAAGLVPAAVTAFPQQELESYQPDQPWPEMPSSAQTYAAAHRAFQDANIGGGMGSYFTELNRKRPPADGLDFVTHTTCPNVHAADDISVMETNEALPFQLLATRSFMGKEIGYRIGPSQLGCRENPYGKAAAPNPGGDARLCLSVVDPRQRGLFNAALMVAYVAACAGGIDQLALGATSGPRGHIYRKLVFPQPGFDGRDGALVYPGFHVIRGLAAQAGAELLTVTANGGKVAAIAARRQNRVELWLANLGTDVIDVEAGQAGSITILDASAFELLTSDPGYLGNAAKPYDGRVRLDSYAVARIIFD